MSRNSLMFPDLALFIHPSIILVDFNSIFTEQISNESDVWLTVHHNSVWIRNQQDISQLRTPQWTHYLLTGSDSLPAATEKCQQVAIKLRSRQLLKMANGCPKQAEQLVKEKYLLIMGIGIVGIYMSVCLYEKIERARLAERRKYVSQIKVSSDSQ